MLTLDEAKNLKPGDILIDTEKRNRWKVNGRVKLWKRDSNRIYIPLKFGLYTYDKLTEDDFENGICKHSLTLERN